MHNNHKVRQKSALIFVLKALIPYSRENVMLAFKPNRFFNELEEVSNYKRKTLEQAFKTAQNQSYVTLNHNLIRLTQDGEKILRPFIAENLPNKAELMIIFDIPEDLKTTRAHLRRVLRSWHFKQVQKSVWVTAYDHRISLKELVDELNISKYVRIFECAEL